MGEAATGLVLVPVVDVTGPSREIGWGSNVSELLTARIGDIRDAIQAGAASVATGLADLPDVQDWQVKEVEASFGIMLAAEAGVILSKASTEATFEVKITFSRKDASDPTGSSGA